jgi:large subunit ribosomal protein L30
MAKKSIRITQIKSVIGATPIHKRTMTALGFRRTYQALVKTDSPQVRGMLQQVRHLVRIEEGK